MIKHNLDGVFGSRILHAEDHFTYKLNKIAVIILSNFINLLYKSSYTDTATNHKLIKTSVMKNLNLISKGFDLDFEIAVKLAKYNYFPIPIGIKITFTPHNPIILANISLEKALSQVEKVIRDGINFKSPR